MKMKIGIAAALSLVMSNGQAFADGADNCADATETPAGTYAFDLALATPSGVANTCGFNSTTSADLWFKHTAALTGTMTVSDCGLAGFDTVLSAFDGCAGAQLACQDDGCGLQSTISFPVTAGQAVLIRVCGYNAAIGAGSITITPPTPPEPGTVFETSDAGDAPSTAMVAQGTGNIPAIVGNIESALDADLFKVTIASPTSFSASTDNTDTLGDTQLWLFDANGIGISSNDDAAGALNIRASALTNVNTASLAAGDYYIGISRYNNDPVDSSGALLWNPCAGGNFTCEVPPDGPGAANAVAGWNGELSGTGTYKINLTGVSFAGATSNCVADVDDGSGTGVGDGAVTIDDLLYFLAQFEAGGINADVDNGTSTGTTDGAVTVDDLLYFLVRFEAGC